MFKRLRSKSEFISNIKALMTGTVISQAIPITISPILTRMYTPEEFGLFGIYISTISFLAVFATLRYEYAIVLPRNKTAVDNLFVGSVLINLIVSLLLLVIVFFFGSAIAITLNIEKLGGWIYFIPLSVFLLGNYNVLNLRLVWMKEYKTIASNKIVLSGSGAISNISIGFAGMTNLGLIIGNILSYAFSILFLIKNNFRFSIKKRRISKRRIFVLLRKNSFFPLENLPSAVLNGLYNNGKLIFIALFFTTSFIGFLTLVLKLLQMPISFVSSSISDVIYKNTVEEYNNKNIDVLIKRLYKVLIALSLIGIVPFGMIFFWGEEIFGFFFGNNWAIAGKYASILTIGLYVMFIASPFTKVFWALKNNRLYLYWEILRLFFFFIPLTYIGLSKLSEIYVVWSMSLSLMVSYLLLIIMLIGMIRKMNNEKV